MTPWINKLVGFWCVDLHAGLTLGCGLVLQIFPRLAGLDGVKVDDCGAFWFGLRVGFLIVLCFEFTWL